MEMHSREQNLAGVREEYGKASKQEKTRVLNETPKRTRLSRKVLIRKLAHRPKSNPRRRGAAVEYTQGRTGRRTARKSGGPVRPSFLVGVLAGAAVGNASDPDSRQLLDVEDSVAARFPELNKILQASTVTPQPIDL